jgi:hypothetical protein
VGGESKAHDLTKNKKNSTTTCHRPTALALGIEGKKPARPKKRKNIYLKKITIFVI